MEPRKELTDTGAGMNITAKIWDQGKTGYNVHAFVDGVALCHKGRKAAPMFANNARDLESAQKFVRQTPGAAMCEKCTARFESLAEKAAERVYERTENGTVTVVDRGAGLAEINHAMMGGRRDVREMSSINRTDYAIDYKDGRSVRLILVDAPAPEGYTQGQAVIVQRPGLPTITGTVAHIHTAPGYVAVTDDRYRDTTTYPTRFLSPAEPEEALEDSAPWSTASHRMLLHKFTEATKDGRAVCNKSYRPWRYGNGYSFETKAKRQASEYAHLYTFCPRCDAK
ncbi:hypothetical protein ABT264_19255 [Streptomyces virginiae]|uniref:hypothetical protein n=1 Tax=Streptomyces virginiae TaxID=1961 RepID=UPI0033169BAD